MARIDEHEIFARYIGERVCDSKLQALARSNGTGYGAYADSKEYIIAHVDYYDKEEYRKLFKLTPTLTERWDYRGIDFSIYLYIRDGIITGGHLFKYIETSQSSHFRPTGYETDATQQELRIADRILQYMVS
ncbi:MAG: hypothetical protein J6L77_00090 [Coprococcus sp.]|nr:hypothetical protein [Coprococcus sp.]